MYGLLSTIAPEIPPDIAETLLAERYGLSGSLTRLPAERDDNFRVEAEGGGRYVLKIHHADEDPSAIELQTEALRYAGARAPGLAIPRVLLARDGSAMSRGPDGRVVRLLSWVEGEVIQHQVPLTAGLRASLGRWLAELDRALVGFQHPAGNRELLWDIQRVPVVRPLLEHIPDVDLRALVARTLDTIEARLLPLLPALPRQVIHNDANPNNVLADPAQVTGVLDFGDVVEAPRIQELAVAAGYYLGEDPVRSMLEMAAAYHAVLPLNRAELRLLPALVAARAVARIAINSWRGRLFGDPEDEVIRATLHPADVLRRLTALGDGAGAALCDALGLE